MSRPGARTRGAALILALVLAGCPAPNPTKPAASATPRKAASAGPRASASPSAVPSGDASPAEDASPAPASAPPVAPPAPLSRPAGEVLVLRGTVAIDAAYAVGSGAAIVANHGAAIVASGAVGIVSNNGGGLISNNGGNLIANNGAGLLSNNGAGLISDRGGGIVANNGAGMVTTGASNVVANNGAGYRLLQAAPALGTILPAAGAVLGVVGLKDGGLIALGQDAAGQPVHAIFTDAAGAYEVYVPKDLAGNVVVRVRFPREAQAAADARLAYDVITAPTAATARVDEDTSLATRYLFDAFAGRFREFLTTTDPEATTRALTSAWVGAPPGLQELMLGLVREFRAEAEKVGLDKAPPAEVQGVARRIIETAMAPVDLDAIVVTQASNSLWKWPDEPALRGVTAALRGLREGAATKIAADPGFMAKQPWFVALNAGRTPPLEVRKPADVGEIMVAEYYVRDMWGSYRKAQAVFDAFGVRVEPGTGIDQVDRISAATSAILTTLGQALITDQDGAKTAALGVVRAWKPSP